MSNETEAELLGQLSRLGARIGELRGARSHITYDLEWAVKERERIGRHLRDLPLLEQGGDGLDDAT
jgi:hypothetical protein